MDNPRLLLWIGLALLVWMNIIQWDRDYGAHATAAAATVAATAAPAAGEATDAGPSTLPALPSSGAAASAPATVGAPALPDSAAPAATAAAGTAAPTIRVVTDVLDLDISLQGGDLLRAELPQYPRDKQPGSPPVRLLTTDDATFSIVRSGLRVADGRAEPTHMAMFTAPATEFRLEPGAQELRVPLTWTDGQGVTVMKTYVFKPGQYGFDLIYDVQNASGEEWKAASYLQFLRHVYEPDRSMFDVESYSFRGPMMFDGKGEKKLDLADDDDLRFTQAVAGGWMAELQHHFVTAAVPPKAETYDYSCRKSNPTRWRATAGR